MPRLFRNCYNNIYNVVVLFLLIFCFPIPKIGNSVWIALFLAFIKIVFCHRVLTLYHYLCSKYVFSIFLATCFLIIYSALVTIGLGIYDLSRTMALISLLVGLLLVLIVYTSLSISHNDLNEIGRLIVCVFLIQAAISILAFISSDVLLFVTLFQYPNDAEVAMGSYAGFRGLAVSGRLYFEFAATCGLVIMVQTKIILDGRISYYMFVSFLLLIACGFFAGRTSLVGLLFAFLLLAGVKVRKGMKIKFVSKLIISLLFTIVLGVVLLPNTIIDFVGERLLPWVFDLFIKYFETGTTEDSYSFNTLNEMYSTIYVTLQEWIIGSGQYVNPDGSYYKYVDAGYLRQLLYWGCIGSFFSIVYSILFFRKPWRRLKNDENGRLLLILLFVYSLVMNYKGDLLGVSRFYYTVLFLYLFHIMAFKSKQSLALE